MIICDNVRTTIDKFEFDNITNSENIELKFHLAECKECLEYMNFSKKLRNIVDDNYNYENDNAYNQVNLTEEEFKILKTTIKNKV